MWRLARALLALMSIASVLQVWLRPPEPGLDLVRGAILSVDIVDPDASTGDALEQVRRGIEHLGVAANVTARDRSISIVSTEIAEDDIDRVIREIQPVDLRFHIVAPSTWWEAVERVELGDARLGSCGREPTLEADSRAELDAVIETLAPLPADRLLLFEAKEDKTVAYLVERAAVIRGRDITSAELEPSLPLQAPTVMLSFTAEAAERVERVTGELVGDCLAIVLSGEVVSAPVIHEPIPGGTAAINMGRDAQATDSERVARALNAGRHIPLKMDASTSTFITPSYPLWIGLPLLRAVAVLAALMWVLAILWRAPLGWLAAATFLASISLSAAVLSTLDGVLTMAFYVGATPAAIAAVVMIVCAGRSAHRVGSLGRRYYAAWPGWLLLVVCAVAAVNMMQLVAFWRGVAIAGVIAIVPTTVLATLGILAVGDVAATKPANCGR